MNILSLSEYSDLVNIPIEHLKGKSRKRIYTIPRFMYWYYLNSIDPIKWSSVSIGRKFNRKHPAVLHGIKQINNYMDTKDSIIEPYEKLLAPFLHQEQTK